MTRCHILLLPLVICLCTSCQTPEQRAVSLVLDCGGKVTRDDSLPGQPVIAVDFRGFPFAASAFDPTLFLHKCLVRCTPQFMFAREVPESDLTYLNAFKDLRSLNLNGTGITDAGVRALKQLTGLEYLSLSNTNVTDAGVKELKELKNLSALDLSGTHITDAGLIDLLKNLKNLRSLHVDGTKVTGTALKAVTELKGLVSLGISCTQITDADLKVIREVTGLTRLWLRGTNITDAGVKELKELKNLEELSLGDTDITDVALKELEELKSLKELDLSETYVSMDGISAFRRAMPKTAVHYTMFPHRGHLPPEHWVPPLIKR